MKDEEAVLQNFVLDSRRVDGLTIRQVRALKNDVLNILCAHLGSEATTAAMLRALYADKTQDIGMRDYALQYLAALSERDRSLGWEAHWLAVEGEDDALAATALIHISIRYRRSELSTAESSQLSAAALRLAADRAVRDSSRTTALRICGQLKLHQARDLAQGLVGSNSASLPLQIAAVATLGDLGGDAETREYLRELSTGGEKRLRAPALSALAKYK